MRYFFQFFYKQAKQLYFAYLACFTALFGLFGLFTALFGLFKSVYKHIVFGSLFPAHCRHKAGIIE